MLSDEEVTEAVAGIIADEIGEHLFYPAPDSGLPQADSSWTAMSRPELPTNVAVIGLTDGRHVWVTATIGPPEGSPS